MDIDFSTLIADTIDTAGDVDDYLSLVLSNLAAATTDQNDDISDSLNILSSLGCIDSATAQPATATAIAQGRISIILNDYSNGDDDDDDDEPDLGDIDLNNIDMTDLFDIDPLISKRLQLSLFMLQRAALLKKKDALNLLPDYDTKSAWCADLTTDMTAGQSVATIELPDEYSPGAINIRPGYEGRSAYSAARDGQITSLITGTAAHTFYNLAMLPALQKWIPHYRVGTISNIDTGADTATVTLDAATSTQQGISINQAEVLTGIPVEYMQCNASAFADDDRVIVEFTQGTAGSGTWDTAKVVGFESEPKGCSVPIVMVQEVFTGKCVLWDYKTNAAPEDMAFVFDDAVAAGEALAARYGDGLYPDEITGSKTISAASILGYNSDNFSSTTARCGASGYLADQFSETVSFASIKTIEGQTHEYACSRATSCPTGSPTCAIGEYHYYDGHDKSGPGCYTSEDEIASGEIETLSTSSPYQTLSLSAPCGGSYIELPGNPLSKKYLYLYHTLSGTRDLHAFREYEWEIETAYNVHEWSESAENATYAYSDIEALDGIGVDYDTTNEHSAAARNQLYDGDTSEATYVTSVYGDYWLWVTGSSAFGDLATWNGGRFPYFSGLLKQKTGIGVDGANMVYFGAVYGRNSQIQMQEIAIYAQTDADPINPADLTEGYSFGFDQCTQINTSTILSNLSGQREMRVYMIKRA